MARPRRPARGFRPPTAAGRARGPRPPTLPTAGPAAHPPMGRRLSSRPARANRGGRTARPNRKPEPHAPLPLFPADPQGDAEGGGDRLAPADAARGHDPAGGGRHLRLAAAGPAGAAQDLRHRARGAEPRRGDRGPDADHPAGRPVARIRPLRRLRQGDAAHPRPARPRHAVRADQRGDDHRNLPRVGALLQGPAAEPLPHPVEVPRRDPAALRRHALARVLDEGRLFVRPRPGRRAPFLQPDVHRLFAHVQADGADRHSDARRHRPDRRRPEPRIHHPGVDRRERGVLPPRLPDVRDAAGRHRLRRRGGDAGGVRQMDVALRRDLREARRRRLREAAGRRRAFRRAASRSAIFSTSEPNTRLR